MRRAALCLTMLVAGLSAGCAGPTPTPTPEPTATATPEPTATATPEGLTVEEYQKGAVAELQKMMTAGAAASKAVMAGAWITDKAARQTLIEDLRTAIAAEQVFKNTEPPAAARDVHARILIMTANYANSMHSLASATDLVAAGDAAGAKKKVDEYLALMGAVNATMDEDIAAMKALVP